MNIKMHTHTLQTIVLTLMLVMTLFTLGVSIAGVYYFNNVRTNGVNGVKPSDTKPWTTMLALTAVVLGFAFILSCLIIYSLIKHLQTNSVVLHIESSE